MGRRVAIAWAKSAICGEYLVTYEDRSIVDDPNGRGYDDALLDHLDDILRTRGLTLVADDHGLRAMLAK
jgi:hypothetical protein